MFRADEVEFPPFFLSVVDGPDLFQVLDLDVGARLVLDEDVVAVTRVVFVIRALRETNAVVFRVVAEAVLLPRHRATRVFLVDATALVVVVVLFAVARRVVPSVVARVPRVEGFSEFLQNPLTGLRMESVVLVVFLQLVFQLFVTGNFAGVVPDLA